MKNQKPLHWAIDEAPAFEELSKTLTTRFKLRQNPPEEHHYELFDNFKWSIWHSGALLLKESGNQFRLHFGTQTLAETADNRTTKFWWHFPEGNFRSKLKRHIGYWAISPVCSLNICNTDIEILNKDEKIVARIRFIEHKLAETSNYYLSILPLRGYHREFSSLLKACKTLFDVPCSEPNIRALLDDKGVSPRPLDKKTFGIEAEEPAEKTVREMTLKMVTKAREFEPGICSDIDTEYLHFYRVSLRKARSLVTLMKPVFENDTQASLKSALAKIAAPTNTLRDLDVFLLNKKVYENLLPENFEQGCQLLFQTFQKERNTELRKVKRFLRSPGFLSTSEQITKILTESEYAHHKISEQPILKLAKKRIYKRYLKVCRLGEAITDATPDDDVHELRIECKKLRYLMEFFSELFPASQIKGLIKALKSLQTILGDFNDYSVQKIFLAEHAEKSNEQAMIAAIYALIGILHQKKLAQRAKVQTAFQAFGSDRTAVEFTSLFS